MKIIITEAQYKKISDTIKGGISDYQSIESIAKKHKVSISKIESQLKIGVPTEMEHTKNKKLALEIALDHLMENPNYYSILKKSGLVD